MAFRVIFGLAIISLLIVASIVTYSILQKNEQNRSSGLIIHPELRKPSILPPPKEPLKVGRLPQVDAILPFAGNIGVTDGKAVPVALRIVINGHVRGVEPAAQYYFKKDANGYSSLKWFPDRDPASYRTFADALDEVAAIGQRWKVGQQWYDRLNKIREKGVHGADRLSVQDQMDGSFTLSVVFSAMATNQGFYSISPSIHVVESR